ncbi:hypothetical protein SSTU70S_05696 [Stutzerimonas stutzeri]
MATEQVFGVVMESGQQRMVAAPTKAAAMRLLAVTQYRLAQHTIDLADSDKALALAQPGIWIRDAAAHDWRRPVEGELTRSSTKGGARAGKRHPRTGPSVTRPRSVRLDDADWALFLALGGTGWLRQKLRKARPPR